MTQKTPPLHALAAAAVLLLPGWATAQKVTLPDSLTRGAGAWFTVPFEVDGGPPRWRLSKGLEEPAGLWNVFPPEMLKAMKGRVLVAYEPGTYWVEAWNAKGDVASDVARCEVKILPVGPSPVPPVPPGPTPVPPGPIPPVPPVPVPAAGFRVLFVYETSMNHTREQLNTLNSTKIAAYLNAKCAKTNGLPDWRRWDKDVKTDNENAVMKQLWADVKPTLPELAVPSPANPAVKVAQPVVVVVSDQKATVYPLPATEQATLELLQKIGGP